MNPSFLPSVLVQMLAASLLGLALSNLVCGLLVCRAGGVFISLVVISWLSLTALGCESLPGFSLRFAASASGQREGGVVCAWIISPCLGRCCRALLAPSWMVMGTAAPTGPTDSLEQPAVVSLPWDDAPGASHPGAFRDSSCRQPLEGSQSQEKMLLSRCCCFPCAQSQRPHQEE